MAKHLGFRSFLKQVPIVRVLARRFKLVKSSSMDFRNSSSYWENRYVAGGNSGAGSYNRLASFKAEIINDFVQKSNVISIIEFGCGDGNQLKLARYPQYFGLDVSRTAIGNCLSEFAGDRTKKFAVLEDYNGESADLALSLDVIYHLVEDDIFEGYMLKLFRGARRSVIIYSSNDESLNSNTTPAHIRHRDFLTWVESNALDWILTKKIVNRFPFDSNNPSNTSFADFYIFEKKAHID